jgi:hypothetical protein
VKAELTARLKRLAYVFRADPTFVFPVNLRVGAVGRSASSRSSPKVSTRPASLTRRRVFVSRRVFATAQARRSAGHQPNRPFDGRFCASENPEVSRCFPNLYCPIGDRKFPGSELCFGDTLGAEISVWRLRTCHRRGPVVSEADAWQSGQPTL